MDRSLSLFLLIFYSNWGACFGIDFGNICASLQYMELGQNGTIHCNFENNFFSVLWYNTTDYSNNNPILHVRTLIKTGPGYTSGEFDAHPNGSLIINNVTLRHERNFTVSYWRLEDEEPVFINVEVVIFVKPSTPFPFFNYCGNVTNICYSEVRTGPVQCQVAKARPAVALQVMIRTLEGDKTIPNNFSLTTDEERYTSRATTTDTFHYSSLLALIVCKASSPTGTLKSTESLILAQNGNVDMSFEQKQLKYIERNTKLHLQCTEHQVGFIVWKKTNVQTKRNDDVLLYSIKTQTTTTKIFVDDVELTNDGSITVPIADFSHGGLYHCVYGNGLMDGVTSFEVVVYGYPVIDGCNHQQYCVLEVEHDGNLTCSLKGIRPLAVLEWKTFYESDTSSITFTEQQIIVRDNGGTYDVTLTSSYHIEDTSRKSLTIECQVAESDMKFFFFQTKVNLNFPEGGVDPINDQFLNKPFNKFLWGIPVIAILFLALLILCTVIIKRRYGKHRKHPQSIELNEEQATLITEQDALREKRDTFVKEIKEKYKDLYDSIQPIPYIKDELYCVNEIYVEGCIEVLDNSGVGRSNEWKKVENFQNVFWKSLLESTRIILEGEPGYGKSLVTLQFAYDWCNSTNTSALKDVEILILIRLRQLRGVKSIYQAIRSLLLPKDTSITEDDITSILANCHSVVMILDGFDEYPDRNCTTTNDIMAIIARQMFQEMKVVITTRSSILLQKYPPSTKRVRLTGFDDNSRSHYISKAVVGKGDEVKVREIEHHLKENPVLSDLCQVPLLFVLFAHTSFGSEKFRNLNSVTRFFRYIISCFQSHMKNKTDDENVCKYKLIEEEHRELNRVAFEALGRNTQKIVWEKEQLCTQIGGEVYNHYLRIGVFVEAEVIDIIDEPDTPITEHVQYKTEVRFFHKLFCEWYAAYYLANFLRQNPNVDLSVFLQHLDPFDVQYMYRFSCGLNATSADKIISYLKNIEGGDKVAILCILEQTGKVDHIKETIRQLCDKGIIISGYDSLLLQRSSMQLLEIAAENDISVRFLRLMDCLQSVNLSTAEITTTSGLVLTPTIPVEILQISLAYREMTEKEAIDLLTVSSMYPSLRNLWYGGCVPPRIFKDSSLLATLKSKDVKVSWIRTKHEPKYSLNLQTGRWENKNDGSEPTEDDFKRMLSEDAEDRERTTEETNKEWVKNAREDLRKRAQKKQGFIDKTDEDVAYAKNITKNDD